MQDTFVLCKDFQQAAKFDILAPAKIPKRPGLGVAVKSRTIYDNIPLQPSLSRQFQKLSVASRVSCCFVFTCGDDTVVDDVCPTPWSEVGLHLSYPAKQWERFKSAEIEIV